MEITESVAYGMVLSLWVSAAIVFGRRINITSKREILIAMCYLTLVFGVIVFVKLYWHNTALWLTTIWGLEYILGAFPKEFRKPQHFVFLNVLGWSAAWVIARTRDVDVSAYFLLVGLIGGMAFGYLSLDNVLRRMIEQKKDC
jgi:hypothetical protein